MAPEHEAMIRVAALYQARDEGLWSIARVFIGTDGVTHDVPISINEDYLQQSLRDLHRVIETMDHEALNRIIQRVSDL